MSSTAIGEFVSGGVLVVTAKTNDWALLEKPRTPFGDWVSRGFLALTGAALFSSFWLSFFVLPRLANATFTSLIGVEESAGGKFGLAVGLMVVFVILALVTGAIMAKVSGKQDAKPRSEEAPTVAQQFANYWIVNFFWCTIGSTAFIYSFPDFWFGPPLHELAKLAFVFAVVFGTRFVIEALLSKKSAVSVSSGKFSLAMKRDSAKRNLRSCFNWLILLISLFTTIYLFLFGF